MATLNRTFSVKNGIDVANTVVLDSSRNLSNIATANANTVNAAVFVTTGGLNLADQANTGRNTANDAYGQANAAYGQANTARDTANDAYSQANSAYGQANAAYGQANAAYGQANAAYGQANAAYGQANAAYDKANAAYSTANAKIEALNAAGAIDISSGVTNNVVSYTINVNRANVTTVGVTKLIDSVSSSDVANAATANAVKTAYDYANTKLSLSGGALSGNLVVANYVSSNGFLSTSTNLAPPNLANTYGERIRLYDFNQAGHPNYSIGVEGSHIWMGVDDVGPGLGFKWYGNTTLVGLLRTNSTFEVSNTVAAKTIRANGTGTAIDASQGNILTNQVTGTQFNFLNGAYTVSINGAGSTSNYALSLPANTGTAGQALVTDGTGNLYWTSSASSTQANDAYAQANTARDTGNNAYAQANTARDAANSAANTVRVSANSGSTLSGKQLNFANSTSVQVSVTDAGDGNANIVFTTTGAAVGDAYAQANAGYAQANTARDTANDAYAQANSGYGQANAAYGQANAAYGQANAAYGQANDAYGQANAAYGQANAAYGEANLKLNLTGGTVSGDLTVQGNLYLTGNATYINVATLKVNDSIIQLSTNSFSDAVDIGFMGHYSEDGGTTNLHAGFIRHASDNVFYILDGYPYEPSNNVIDIASANLAWLRANVNAASLLLEGNVVATQANLTLAHTAANNASNTANGAYGQANGAYAQANGAYAQANGAYASANGAYAQANGAYAQANGAYAQANAANDNANTRVLKSGDTMTGGLTITTTGVGLSVANANVAYSLRVGTLNVTTNTVTTSSSGQVVLDVFTDSQLASAKYFVQAKSGSDYHTTEVVLVQDATNVWITEYGSIQTGPSLGTFSADISSGDVRLLFNAVNNVNTIRTVRYGIIP